MNSNVTRMPTPAEVDADLEVFEYVAGHMSDEARDDFERRIADDPQLAARVAEERDLAAGIQAAFPEQQPDAAAFDAIRPGRSKTAVEWWGRTRLLAVAASVAMAAVLVVVMQPAETPFRTLSDDPVQRVDSATTYRVVFSADSDATARADAAAAFGFTVVSGPGAGGAYIVETESQMTREQLDSWRRDGRIEFAEPVRYEVER